MKFSDAAQTLAYLVPTCPVPELIQAMRFATIEFASTTKVMTQWFETTSDMLTFDTSVGPANLQITDVFDAFVDGRRVAIPAVNSPRLAKATTDAPVVVHTNDISASLSVIPRPEQARSVRLLVALAPTPEANEFSDYLWKMHQEELRFGTLARLMAEAGTPYSNEGRATWNGNRFADAMNSIATKLASNRIRAAKRLRVANDDGQVADDDIVEMPSSSIPREHVIYWTDTTFWTATNYWM